MVSVLRDPWEKAAWTPVVSVEASVIAARLTDSALSPREDPSSSGHMGRTPLL